MTTFEDLYTTLDDASLPLPARLDAARELIRWLEETAVEIRQDVRTMVTESPRDDDLTATLYWEYDDLIPTALLGKFYEMRQMLEERCPWTFPCPDCGRDQPVTSRTALKELQRGGNPPTARRCTSCADAKHQRDQTAWRAQHAAYHQRLRQLKRMPYREYLRTPEWQERRKARLAAARYACQVCNRRGTKLNVHHRTYVRRGEEYARDLIVLCEGCHHLFHRNGTLAPHGEGDR